MRFAYNLKSIWVVFVFIFLVGLDADAKSAKAKRGKSKASPPSVSSAVDDGSGDYVTEKRSDGTTVKYKKKTSYDFEGLGVEAMADKPTGAYISNIKDVKAKTLIQIRKDFDAEVNESARQMP